MNMGCQFKVILLHDRTEKTKPNWQFPSLQIRGLTWTGDPSTDWVHALVRNLYFPPPVLAHQILLHSTCHG